ncbi:MAG: 3-isopropylmalate dehydratase large subunit [Chloroflexota bacterium]
MTLAEAILAAHAGRSKVSAGELVNVKVDLILANDITGPLSIQEFERIGVGKLFDPSKIVLVPDHFAPNKDIKAAEQAAIVRRFVKEHGTRYYEVGRMGIEHVLLPEQGLVLPGDLVIGADSHTCTYGALGAFATGMGSTDIAAAMAMGEIWMKVPPTIKFVYRGSLKPWVGGKDLILHTIGDIGVDGALYAAMEFTGEAVSDLSMDGRFTMANMAIEAGAKAGLFEVDDKTIEYVSRRASRPYTIYRSDKDAHYEKVIEYDCSQIEPLVACPHLPSNVKPARELSGVSIDQSVIGSCTNGRLEDLRIAARILKGQQVHPYVRCIVIPGTQEVYRQALREGLVETFIEARAVVSTPTCGPCLGGYMGILAAGERAISTTNRNFIGRMGSPQSEVYLSGPAIAAASAVLGRIGTPEEVIA